MRVVPLAVLLAAVLAAACSDKSSSPTVPVTRQASAAAAAYLDTALSFEQEVFYYGSRMNFPAQAAAVRDSANRAAAQARSDTLYHVLDYSIDPFLRNAGDQHSAFFWPNETPGEVDSPANDPRYQVSGLMLPATAGVRTGAPVAYVWFPTYDGTNDNGRADSTQAVIRALDQNAPCGWVLDLRFNPGGQPTAMMAGLNPLIGDTPLSGGQRGFGGWVDYENFTAYLYVQAGTAGEYDPSTGKFYPQVRATNPYTLQRPNSPVAILVGPYTASAGEWLTLGFNGGPVPHRTFGAPTYGVTTVPYNYEFADHGFLNITAGVMMDRLGNRYGSALTPDQAVTGTPTANLLPTQAGTAPDAVVKAAVTWVQSQPACGGVATALRAPSFSRDVSSTVPPAIKTGRGITRISRHWSTRLTHAAPRQP